MKSFFDSVRSLKIKKKCYSVLKVQPSKKGIVGVYDGEDPPVPIPNTVVKLAGAENTWLETARENRAMPTLLFFLYIKRENREEFCARKIVIGVDNVGGPPVPIPNTVVKPKDAENTWLETARENRETPIKETWPVGQAVKTVASHAAIESSTLSRVTKQNCEKGYFLFSASYNSGITAHIRTISSVG